MENRFIIRNYLPEKDLPTLAALLTEVESIDRDGEDTSEEALRSALQWPGFQPEKDAWVAEYDNSLVGYAVTLNQPGSRSTLYVVVHPEQRRAGLGSRLLNLAIARARDAGAKDILIYANDRNQASKSFLQKHGLAPVGSSGTMKSPGNRVALVVRFPQGFSLKRFSAINDIRILAIALNDCYLGMWGHHHSENPSEDNPQASRFLEHFGADNILILFDADKSVCGICSVRSAGLADENGEMLDILDAPGVIQKYRQDGLQRLLVLAGKKRLQEQAMRTIRLEFWGEDPQTLEVYTQLGFKMHHHYIAYHRELA